MARSVLAMCAVALACTGASAAARTDTPTVQSVTITGAGGVQLACGFVLPIGTAPDGGWPGIVFFPDVASGSDANPDQVPYAEQGFASVSCDERGWMGSGGSFDLAGPNDAADAQKIFDWLAGQPDVSGSQIGAFGYFTGGAAVWDAAVAGVPFKAIVPADAWSSLARELHPSGVPDVEALDILTSLGPSTWNTPSGIAACSYRAGMHSLTIPTLIVNGRALLVGDLSQATVPYRLLGGPKRLLIANLPEAGDYTSAPEVLAWFRKYLAGGPSIGQGVEIQHEAPDTKTTTFTKLPPTRWVNVNLPGTRLTRRVWLPGGPHETFGGGSITIRYSDASWKQVVARVATASGKFVTEGAMPVTHEAGVLKIPLVNDMRLLERGKKLRLTFSSYDSRFGGTSGGTIAIGRVTLKLSVLQRAVSH